MLDCPNCTYPMTPRRYDYDHDNPHAPVYDWDCPTCGYHVHREPTPLEDALEHLVNTFAVMHDALLRLVPALAEAHERAVAAERQRSRDDLNRKRRALRQRKGRR